MKINESNLTTVIRKMLAARLLKEFSDQQSPVIHAPETEQGLKNLSAIRLLKIRAREDSLDFESIIRKELKLIDPNSMDGLSQKVYIQAAEQMGEKIIAAAIDMVKSVEHLPTIPEEGDAASTPQVKLNVAGK